MFKKIIGFINVSMLLMTLCGCSTVQQLVHHENKCTSSSGLLSCGKGKLITHPFFIEVGDGVINLEFTWKGVNENIANPLNRSQLECQKQDGVCTEISANNIVNNDGSILGPLLFVDMWDILSWSNSEIILTNHAPRCAKAVMTIDLKNQKITNVRTANNPLPGGCTPPEPPIFITESVSE